MEAVCASLAQTLGTWDAATPMTDALAHILHHRFHIKAFFKVQKKAIPEILQACRSTQRRTDFCISAPTGSGKTFTYLIPILLQLQQRIICRLRALIVVPTRDLATQVHQVASVLCGGTKLKCAVVTGQANFGQEQRLLSDTHSGIDILIATPGRLVDHLEQTNGFTLQHLQFLIVDEADRLLTQSYQDWIAKVYQSVYSTVSAVPLRPEDNLVAIRTIRTANGIQNHKQIRVPFIRVLLSATLTENPSKLALIGMHYARVLKIKGSEGEDSMPKAQTECELDADSVYETPEKLEEWMIECDSDSKPLRLIQLLLTFKDQMTLIFTSSVNATHRLTRLLQLVFKEHSDDDVGVQEYSSSLTLQQRRTLVAKCKKGLYRILVCSDAMARGMDLDDVVNVINYDVPSFIKTYIHRAGRAARAGRFGRCVTLVKRGQTKGLQRMLQKAKKKKLLAFPLPPEEIQQLVPVYMKALQNLKETLEMEASGTLKATGRLIPKRE
uniref:ATP-dependent RNA helicase n=1 Tax=Albugo laibachii Nc14 TaxID=890382 RepID=F0WNK9_9STRA|nr:DEAD/DEAH box RNA helicase putative [Albugo laibachii Nc14]|eukprot:CCA22900.1 DEAD/DEAH box RNA helicase putative [Albugo laibachii Nc14]